MKWLPADQIDGLQMKEAWLRLLVPLNQPPAVLEAAGIWLLLLLLLSERGNSGLMLELTTWSAEGG